MSDSAPLSSAPRPPFPRTRLTWVRHGQADSTAGYDADTPLTDLGQRQALATASELAGWAPFDVVYTSPFRRARETAQPFCEKLGQQVLVEERLSEYDFGPEGVPDQDPPASIRHR